VFELKENLDYSLVAIAFFSNYFNPKLNMLRITHELNKNHVK